MLRPFLDKKKKKEVCFIAHCHYHIQCTSSILCELYDAYANSQKGLPFRIYFSDP